MEFFLTVLICIMAQTLISHHDIRDTGLYVLFMAVCDPAASPVELDGSVDSLDPCEECLPSPSPSDVHI